MTSRPPALRRAFGLGCLGGFCAVVNRKSRFPPNFRVPEAPTAIAAGKTVTLYVTLFAMVGRRGTARLNQSFGRSKGAGAPVGLPVRARGPARLATVPRPLLFAVRLFCALPRPGLGLRDLLHQPARGRRAGRCAGRGAEAALRPRRTAGIVRQRRGRALLKNNFPI